MAQNLTGYPSIDKPWMKYYSEETKNAKVPECTVYENIYKNNAKHLENTALIYFGHKITYAKLFEQVEKAKCAFQALGVKKNDRVVLYTSSTPEMLYTVLALCRIGATANMINPLFTSEQARDRINETEATVMVVLDQLYGKIEEVIPQTCVKTVIVIPVYASMAGITKMVATLKKKKKLSYNENLISWDSFLVKGAKITALEDAPYEKDRPLIMVYSSGTTGASKAIVLTNDGINATIFHYLSPEFPYEQVDRFLQVIPVWFSTGLVLSILVPVCLGVAAVMEPVFSKENFARDIKKYKPNMTLATTGLWLYAAKSKEWEQMDLSFLMYPVEGGEQVIPRVEEQMNQFFREHNCNTAWLKGYGMCELGSTVATDSADVHKIGATGFPIAGVTVAAFDMETNEEMRYNQRGEIRVLTPCRMKEYYRNPEATEKFFYKDASGNLWGCTGDIGYVDEDGFIFILGRASDTFTSKSGQKIYCFDIENVVLENENIAQCEVVGHDRGGFEVPAVHIILEETCKKSQKEILEEVHQNCISKLPEECIPGGYKFCDAFPVKNNGKRDMELIRQDREGFMMPEGKREK